ncbi:MAG: TRAP transporter TatT component family protein [Treponema sp.]|nr:TRAP transporter TatT component family protein [Treponema sp.]
MIRKIWGIALLGAVLSSCSINKLAINAVSDALGGGSSDVFTGDDDPELVGDAIPFAIKIYETLLAQNPRHEGLILTTGSLFIMYANAFVQSPAEMLDTADYQKKQNDLARAKKLYLRGADILYKGLEIKYPGFTDAYRRGGLDVLLAKTKKEDAPLLYWCVAGILSAYSLDPFSSIGLGNRIRDELYPMILRAYELDPDFNRGAIDDFFVLFYASLPETMGGDKSKVDLHFERAIEKSQGMSASPYVSYAQAVAVPAQDYTAFKEKLEQALAIDVEADPGNRLVNILSQRKARFLLDNASVYFIELENTSEWEEWEDAE